MKLQGEGCLKPLIVWREENTLLDGHHSLAVYEKHEIPYTVEYMPFPNREMAIEWVIDNQLGPARNLTERRRSYYRGKKYLNQKQAQGGSERFDGSPSPHGETMGDTAENIGSDDGVSRAQFTVTPPSPNVDQLSPRPGKGAERPIRCSQEPDCRRSVLRTLHADRAARETAPMRRTPGQAKRKQEAAARKQKPRENPHAHLPKSVQNALADTWHADSAHPERDAQGVQGGVLLVLVAGRRGCGSPPGGGGVSAGGGAEEVLPGVRGAQDYREETVQQVQGRRVSGGAGVTCDLNH